MKTPFDMLGGEPVARQVAQAFYRHMEPALVHLHPMGDDGHVHPDVVKKFSLFFIGWLGGPQTYIERHGHPRLRMRHASVPIDEAMRDAWLRAMQKALDEVGVSGEIRSFLDHKLADIADFLRNR